MAASNNGNSSSLGSGSGTGSPIPNSGSEGDLQLCRLQVMDLRKRKRMESNRESARRSRMRKQKHLDDLMIQVTTLRKENSEIMTSINTTNQLFLNVDAENSILKVRIMELGQRLHSIEEIVNGASIFDIENNCHGQNRNQDYDYNHDQVLNHDNFVNPWNLLYVNQPIMAAASANTFDQY